MNRKAQVEAIREIFQFGLGLALLIGVVYLFYNTLIPTVSDYSLRLEAENINSHINYLIMEMIEVYNQDMINGSVSLTYDLPAGIEDYSYTVFLSEQEICTIINGLDIKDCFTLNTGDISVEGIYLSGGEMNLILEKGTTSRLLLRN